LGILRARSPPVSGRAGALRKACQLEECRHMSRRSKVMGGKLHASMRSLIGSLVHDTAGNTLGIALATIILLVSLAGSGTDMARAYMTKTSLQNACDAGVLAGRKLPRGDP
jgi:hypothetical protein